MGWIDTHCHLADREFDRDRTEVIQRARESGAEALIVPGVDSASSREVVRLAEEHPEIRAAVGVHPHHAGDWTARVLDEIRGLLGSGHVAAIGEIGLDYFRLRASSKDQETAFREQLELAAEWGLPVIVHVRDSLPAVLSILKEWAGVLGGTLADRRGVLHAYSGDGASASQAVELGFYLGVGGPITFPNARDRRQVTSQLPRHRLLLETDSPYLAPQAHRGRRNEPSFLPLIADELARLLGTTAHQIETETARNARELLYGVDGTHHRDLL